MDEFSQSPRRASRSFCETALRSRTFRGSRDELVSRVSVVGVVEEDHYTGRAYNSPRWIKTPTAANV